MEWSEPGIVVGARRYGEADVIIEVLTEGHGRHLGLVRGRALAADAAFPSARQYARADLARSAPRAPRQLSGWSPWSSGVPASPRPVWVLSGLQLARRTYGSCLSATRIPGCFHALHALLDCFDQPPLAAELMVRFELLLLDEMGFGLDLESCARDGRARGTRLCLAAERAARSAAKPACPMPIGSAAAGFLQQSPGSRRAARPSRTGFLLTGYFP
jgi:DNA repair protein RecO (recombination protein O)